MSNDITLVIFDLDGTLVDAYKAVVCSVNYTLTQMNCALVDDATIKRRVGWGDRHLIGTFVREQNIDRALSIFRQHHARALKGGTTFLPGARKLLDELREKNYKLAVASNRPARFTHIILKHLNIQHVFDYVVCGDQVACPKPAADILEQALKKFSLTPKETLYVGDMAIDVETGNEAGIKTIAVLTGSSTREDIVRLKPFKIIKNVYEVAEIVGNM